MLKGLGRSNRVMSRWLGYEAKRGSRNHEEQGGMDDYKEVM